MKKAIITGSMGAVAMYLFDPQLGRTRRAKLAQQLRGLNRRVARDAGRKAEYARDQAEGLRHIGDKGSVPENDPALTAKVESEVLSRWNFPKSDISVNSIDGVVELRGICETPDQIDELEQRVRKVTGVVDVHNYLHLPNTPAPNKVRRNRREPLKEQAGPTS
ncbi:MAG: BON domain-containing protein [Actinomycetota bacterium]